MRNYHLKQYIILSGAAFMSAMASTGPALMTQIAKFTSEYGFTMIIIIVLIITMNIIVQRSIWKISAGSNMYINDIADEIVQGYGKTLIAILLACGLIFNIGNIGGASLAINGLTNWNIKICILVTVCMGILLFAFNNAKIILDRLIQIFGVLLLLLLIFASCQNRLHISRISFDNSFLCSFHDLCFVILTLLGTSIGGYSVISGVHSIVEEKMGGVGRLKVIETAATISTIFNGIMRLLLFFASFSVVAMGYSLGTTNPLLTVFQISMNKMGSYIFSIVLLVSSCSCLMVCTYASITFLHNIKISSKSHTRRDRILFMLSAGIVMLLIGEPAKLLIIAGTIAGLSVPFIILIPIICTRVKGIMPINYPYSFSLWIMDILCLLISLVAIIGAFPETINVLFA
jgi:Mn2+/Fe2+ NRAMP family transporter